MRQDSLAITQQNNAIRSPPDPVVSLTRDSVVRAAQEFHPLDPLSAAEIAAAASACRLFALQQSLKDQLRFNTITLAEPVKTVQLAWGQGRGPRPPRIAFCIVQVPSPGVDYVIEASVVLQGDITRVTSWRKVEGVQPLVTIEDCIEAEEIFKEDAEVQRVCRQRYGIADMQYVACDPWYYGERFAKPGEEQAKGRFIQCFLYRRSANKGLHDNFYSHPLDLVVTLDMNSRKVVSMWMQEGSSHQVPPTDCNYHRELIEKPWRIGLKPLNVVQPEGPSWQVDGNQVQWQNWHLRVGFNYREGLVLHQIGYEDGGRVRPIVYRASTVEIIVPYADPRRPFHRKCAFDATDYGLGVGANSLALGCDCLGAIYYFDGILMDAHGEPMVIKNAICMHEEDYGLLWKHTEYRTNHVESRRSRRLVISSVATFANYEYGFFWYFYQDGSIQHEVKLTGILSTNGLSEGEGPHPEFGTLLAPGLNAQHHQHFFQVRLDMAVDCDNGGARLEAYEVNCESMPDGPNNPHGVGFYVQNTLLQTEQEAIRNADAQRSRLWKIINPRCRNPMNGQPVGWKLVPSGSTPPMYASPSSSHARRGVFATKHLWVTPYAEDEKFPAGLYPLEPNPLGIGDWTASNRNLAGADLVVWHTLGVTHVPRPEDYPVMPCEYTSFYLKPFNFFDVNPAINLPPSCNKASVHVRTGGGCCAQAAIDREDRVADKAAGVGCQGCCASSSGCRCSASCGCVTGCACKRGARSKL